MSATRIARITIEILTCITIFFIGTVWAVAPTAETIERWRAEGTLEKHWADWRAFKEAGGCSPNEHSVFNKEHYAAKLASNPNAVDTINVVVILVDFSDYPYTGQSVAATKQQFDSILFSDRLKDAVFNNSGSMTDYYREISYGKAYVHGEIYGWYRMPQTYAYYVGSNTGLTNGTILARDAAAAANPDCDFSKFENGSGTVSIIVIHAGPGAEEVGSGIWSHKSTVSGYPVFDGAVISNYTLNPEEFGGSICPIGVFCHEYGHVLGLPDLYDTDYTPNTSEGLGAWSLMASGNYQGGSRYPVHMDAWCKRQIGFLDSFYVVTQNKFHAPIPAAEYSDVAYMLPDSNDLSATKEYWLVENRQPRGFDLYLPGNGLLIYHVDRTVSGNNNYLRYQVAVEQADGLDQLALGGSRGDNGDPWPGDAGARYFGELSIPNSHTNASDVPSQVGVWNVTNSDSVMYADFDYIYSRPWFVLYGVDSLVLVDTANGANNDGTFQEGESVDFYCRVRNLLRNAYQYTVSLSTTNPNVEFLTNNVAQDNLTIPATLSAGQRSIHPVRFRLKPGSPGAISPFTLTVTVDSAFGSGDRKFTKSFTFNVQLGSPQVLLVDDDNGQNAQDVVGQSFLHLSIPYKVWNKSTLGSPTSTDLAKYKHIFWIHGDKPTGTLTAADVTALKAFLNAGGNLAMGSATAATQLKTLDSVFMRDYLHARFIDSVTSGFYFWGVTGVPMSEGLRWRYLTTVTAPIKRIVKLEATSGGVVAFQFGNYVGAPNLGDCGVIYQGSYKTLFTSFAFEYLSDRDTLANWAHRDSLFARVMNFFGGNATGIDDGTTPSLPKAFSLGQNYPNPFNPSTVIQYSINYTGRSGDARARTLLSVYNLAGQRVRTLVDRVQGPGEYKVDWDGRDDSGGKVSTGVYLYRLERGDRSESRKMVLLK